MQTRALQTCHKPKSANSEHINNERRFTNRHATPVRKTGHAFRAKWCWHDVTVANNRTSQTVPKSKQWIAQICIPLFNVPALTVRLSYRLHPDVLSSVFGGRARQAIQTTGLSSHGRAGCWYTQCLILGKYTTAWCDIGSHFPSHSDPPLLLSCPQTANGKSCYVFFSPFFLPTSLCMQALNPPWWCRGPDFAIGLSILSRQRARVSSGRCVVPDGADGGNELEIFPPSVCLKRNRKAVTSFFLQHHDFYSPSP